MDDTTAFEHQVENVLQHTAGPSLPVDAVSIVESATTDRWTVITRRLRRGATTPTEGGFTMFSALKFVAAGVIVALFGGFLLAGVLTTQQGDGVAPAAVTESPSPMTSEQLLSGMVTEEVEPGVYRVVNDGVRDLVLGPQSALDIVVADQDGSIWWLKNSGHLSRLGLAATHDVRLRASDYVDEMEVVVAVPDAVAVAGRVAWGVPRRPGQAATACAPVAVTKCLTRRDSHAIR